MRWKVIRTGFMNGNEGSMKSHPSTHIKSNIIGRWLLSLPVILALFQDLFVSNQGQNLHFLV